MQFSNLLELTTAEKEEIWWQAKQKEHEKSNAERTQEAMDLAFPAAEGLKRWSVFIQYRAGKGKMKTDTGHPIILVWAKDKFMAGACYQRVCGILSISFDAKMVIAEVGPESPMPAQHFDDKPSDDE